MKFMKLIFASVTALWLAGCYAASTSLANLNVHFDSAHSIRNIYYDKMNDQKLDIFLPQGHRHHIPVIVFFYGGRWASGTKEEYAFVAKNFTEHGFAVVIPDYRKYPSVKFPAFVEDGAKAISWVYNHIEDYGGDKRSLFVVGHSAGAHIGALLASDRRYNVRNKIQGFAGLAGPYDFTPHDPDLVDIFGPPDYYDRMQVPTFIDGHEPPMLLLWGKDDTTVEYYNLDRLATKIKSAGGWVETKIYPGIDHIWIIGSLSWLGRSKAPVADDITRFFSNIMNHDHKIP